MSFVEKVKRFLVGNIDNTPMSVSEFNELLTNIKCSWGGVFDHGEYVSDVINEECLDGGEDEEEYTCNIYTVTRYKLAWLGLVCGDQRLVAVLRNFTVIEKNGVFHIIVYYDVHNVVANEKLYDIVNNKVVAREISRRKLIEFAETSSKVMPEILKMLTPLVMMRLMLDALSSDSYSNK
jgi:hypothetical protein